MKKLCLLLIALIGVTSLVYAQSSADKTTIYIVRHGEKDLSDPKNPDPQLSSEGLARAKSLAARLKREKFAAVFSTKYKRTTQTGELVAKKNKVAIAFYNPSDPKSLAELIKSRYKGKKVLIIGHSNTVLELAEAFGVTRPLFALTDDDYDFIFKVDVNDNGYASLSTGNYGMPHHTSVIKKN
ncbi:SixA phosphatase family protein [Daejeonella lutea]|uniref:Histidine phosphatase superfamily (Branch 1) n=1 Tax=Daejeonella lutea TaxID=572036 RepID=A0A1T5DLR4_9SPHI|nr:histidine phosphatase family protein [Daejeonella lutea]SKB72625.1 Histidine phosphatase superfamily (branch 1) [Daejeonella lutea]